MKDKIIQGDCYEEIQEIADGSVDAIITDPPYALGFTHNGQKGDYSDLTIIKPFFTQLFKQFKRVLKDQGEGYIFTDWRTYSILYPLSNNLH